MGVAHLVERSLPKSEVHSSNPAIRKFNIEQLNDYIEYLPNYYLIKEQEPKKSMSTIFLFLNEFTFTIIY